MPQRKKRGRPPVKVKKTPESRESRLKPMKGKCNFRRPDMTYCRRNPANKSPLIKDQVTGDLVKRCVSHGANAKFGSENASYRNGLWVKSIPRHLQDGWRRMVEDQKLPTLVNSLAASEMRMLELLARADAVDDVNKELTAIAEKLRDSKKKAATKATLDRIEACIEAMGTSDDAWAEAGDAMDRHAALLVKHQKHLQDNRMLVHAGRVRMILTQIRDDIMELVTDQSMQDAVFERFDRRAVGGAKTPIRGQVAGRA